MDTKDHDLLIKLDTKMDALTENFNHMRDNVVTRVTALEEHKVDKRDFEDTKKIIDNKVDKTDFDGYKKTNTEKINDHESRMRRNERIIYIATGAVLLLQIILGTN